MKNIILILVFLSAFANLQAEADTTGTKKGAVFLHVGNLDGQGFWSTNGISLFYDFYGIGAAWDGGTFPAPASDGWKGTEYTTYRETGAKYAIFGQASYSDKKNIFIIFLNLGMKFINHKKYYINSDTFLTYADEGSSSAQQVYFGAAACINLGNTLTLGIRYDNLNGIGIMTGIRY